MKFVQIARRMNSSYGQSQNHKFVTGALTASMLKYPQKNLKKKTKFQIFEIFFILASGCYWLSKLAGQKHEQLHQHEHDMVHKHCKSH